MQIYHAKTQDAHLPRLSGLEPLRRRPQPLRGAGADALRAAVDDGAGLAGRLVRGAGALRHDGPRQRLQARHRDLRGRPPADRPRRAGSSTAPRRRCSQYPSSVEFFFPDGKPPRPGNLHKQPDLARTFRALVEGGPDAYYQGRDRRQDRRLLPGQRRRLITKRDLADLTVEWVDPLGITLPRLHRLRPAAAVERDAVAADAQAAGGLRPGRDGPQLGRLPAHADRGRAAGDRRPHPLQRPSPTRRSPRCFGRVLRGAAASWSIRQRASRIVGERYARTHGRRACASPATPSLRESTTHFNVVDAEGNAVSCTQSLGGFGCGVVVPGHRHPAQRLPLLVRSRRRQPERDRPAQEERDVPLAGDDLARRQALRLHRHARAATASWRRRRSSWSNMMDFGMTVQAAIEAPRVRPQEMNRVIVEGRIPAAVRDGLTAARPRWSTCSPTGRWPSAARRASWSTRTTAPSPAGPTPAATATRSAGSAEERTDA